MSLLTSFRLRCKLLSTEQCPVPLNNEWMGDIVTAPNQCDFRPGAVLVVVRVPS